MATPHKEITATEIDRQKKEQASRDREAEQRLLEPFVNELLAMAKTPPAFGDVTQLPHGATPCPTNRARRAVMRGIARLDTMVDSWATGPSRYRTRQRADIIRAYGLAVIRQAESVGNRPCAQHGRALVDALAILQAREFSE